MAARVPPGSGDAENPAELREDALPPLWKIPLFGTDNGDTPLDRLRRAAKSDREPADRLSQTPQNEAIWPEPQPESDAAPEPERER